MAEDWHLEEDWEKAKDLGLDHYEVRCFIGWYRHITLGLWALADFPGICATERCSTSSLSPPAPSLLPPRPAVLALSVPEVRHLRARLIWPASSSAGRVLECRVGASLPSKSCQLFPSQTSSRGWLILAGSQGPALGLMLSSTHFPDVQEISCKCWSSWKSVAEGLSSAFPRKEFCV